MEIVTLPEIGADDRAWLEAHKIHPDLWVRITVEREVFRRTCQELFNAGFQLALHDGEDWATPRTINIQKLVDAMMATDEETLVVYHRPDIADAKWQRFGWVFFVYGNSGWDVINDYTVNLEDVLKPVNEYTDALSELYA